MAAGDVTQGRARPAETDVLDLEPGDYCVKQSRDGQRIAWVCVPNGHVGRLEGWTLTEHDDGTVTLSPSILCHETTLFNENDQRVTIPEWHGYLEQGVWREV